MKRRWLVPALLALVVAAGCRPADGGAGSSPEASAAAPSQAESSAPATESDDGDMDYGY